MRVKDLSVKWKIIGGFSLVTLVTLTIGIIGFSGVTLIHKEFDDVSDTRLPSIEYLGRLEANLERVNAGYLKLLGINLEPQQRLQILEEINKYRAAYNAALEVYAPLEQTHEEAEAYNIFLNDLTQWREYNVAEINPLVEKMYPSPAKMKKNYWIRGFLMLSPMPSLVKGKNTMPRY